MNATASTTTRDDTIVTMRDEIAGMVYNFARNHGLEFDDCMQDACEIMLRIWPRIPADVVSVKAYLRGAVKSELYRRLHSHGVQTMSLDTPIIPGSTETFADMLQEFVQQDSQRSEHVAKTVHSALRNLSLEVQLHARDYYGLGDYRPALPRKSVKVVYDRKKEYMRKSLRTAFRSDPHVLSLLQCETAIL